MPHRVPYRAFANHLAALSLLATREQMAVSLEVFFEHDAEYAERFANVVRALPEGTDLLAGLEAICRLLQADNSRFLPGLFLEWALEGK